MATWGPFFLTVNRPLEILSGALSATAVFAIMALTFYDVGGRKLLSNSIPGSLELTEMLMVVVIFAALPMVSRHDEHVVFDSLDDRLPAALRRWQHRIVHLLCAAMLLGLAWVMWDAAGQFLANGETSAQLKIPKAPFLYGMSVMAALTALAHLALWRQDPRSGADDGSGVAL